MADKSVLKTGTMPSGLSPLEEIDSQLEHSLFSQPGFDIEHLLGPSQCLSQCPSQGGTSSGVLTQMATCTEIDEGGTCNNNMDSEVKESCHRRKEKSDGQNGRKKKKKDKDREVGDQMKRSKVSSNMKESRSLGNRESSHSGHKVKSRKCKSRLDKTIVSINDPMSMLKDGKKGSHSGEGQTPDSEATDISGEHTRVDDSVEESDLISKSVWNSHWLIDNAKKKENNSTNETSSKSEFMDSLTQIMQSLLKRDTMSTYCTCSESEGEDGNVGHTMSGILGELKGLSGGENRESRRFVDLDSANITKRKEKVSKDIPRDFLTEDSAIESSANSVFTRPTKVCAERNEKRAENNRNDQKNRRNLTEKNVDKQQDTSTNTTSETSSIYCKENQTSTMLSTSFRLTESHGKKSLVTDKKKTISKIMDCLDHSIFKADTVVLASAPEDSVHFEPRLSNVPETQLDESDHRKSEICGSSASTSSSCSDSSGSNRSNEGSSSSDASESLKKSSSSEHLNTGLEPYEFHTAVESFNLGISSVPETQLDESDETNAGIGGKNTPSSCCSDSSYITSSSHSDPNEVFSNSPAFDFGQKEPCSSEYLSTVLEPYELHTPVSSKEKMETFNPRLRSVPETQLDESDETNAGIGGRNTLSSSCSDSSYISSSSHSEPNDISSKSPAYDLGQKEPCSSEYLSTGLEQGELHTAVNSDKLSEQEMVKKKQLDTHGLGKQEDSRDKREGNEEKMEDELYSRRKNDKVSEINSEVPNSGTERSDVNDNIVIEIDNRKENQDNDGKTFESQSDLFPTQTYDLSLNREDDLEKDCEMSEQTGEDHNTLHIPISLNLNESSTEAKLSLDYKIGVKHRKMSLSEDSIEVSPVRSNSSEGLDQYEYSQEKDEMDGSITGNTRGLLKKKRKRSRHLKKKERQMHESGVGRATGMKSGCVVKKYKHCNGKAKSVSIPMEQIVVSQYGHSVSQLVKSPLQASNMSVDLSEQMQISNDRDQNILSEQERSSENEIQNTARSISKKCSVGIDVSSSFQQTNSAGSTHKGLESTEESDSEEMDVNSGNDDIGHEHSDVNDTETVKEKTVKKLYKRVRFNLRRSTIDRKASERNADPKSEGKFIIRVQHQVSGETSRGGDRISQRSTRLQVSKMCTRVLKTGIKTDSCRKQAVSLSGRKGKAKVYKRNSKQSVRSPRRRKDEGKDTGKEKDLLGNVDKAMSLQDGKTRKIVTKKGIVAENKRKAGDSSSKELEEINVKRKQRQDTSIEAVLEGRCSTRGAKQREMEASKQPNEAKVKGQKRRTTKKKDGKKCAEKETGNRSSQTLNKRRTNNPKVPRKIHFTEQCTAEKPTVVWSAEEDQKLIAAVQELKQGEKSESLKWKKVEAMVTTKTSHQCYKRWYGHLNRFTSHKKRGYRIQAVDQLKLITCVWHQHVNCQRQIDWKKIVENFHSNFSEKELTGYWSELKRNNIQNFQQMSFTDVLSEMVTTLIPKLENRALYQLRIGKYAVTPFNERYSCEQL